MTHGRRARTALQLVVAAVIAHPAAALADGDAATVSASNAIVTPDMQQVEISGSRVPPPDRSGASVTVLTHQTLESLPGGETQPLSYALATQPGSSTTPSASACTRGALTATSSTSSTAIPLLTVPLGQYGVGSFIPPRLVQSLQLTTGGFPGGWQIAQGQGVASERYLFTPQELAFTGWETLDHVQTWTANVGFDVHDAGAQTTCRA